jgi:hypothetical protein
MTAIAHIAGGQLQVGQQLRQRCAWCGALLEDYDLTRIAAPEWQDPVPSLWEPGAVVEFDGGAARVIEHENGLYLPLNCCAAVDPAVTR